MAKEKIKILFLCSANSCRSQMAEGWARALKGDAVEPHSAGIVSSGLNPSAVKVMAEAGVSIENQASKSAKDVQDILFDYIVTVCSEADAVCPAGRKSFTFLLTIPRSLPKALARKKRPSPTTAVCAMRSGNSSSGCHVYSQRFRNFRPLTFPHDSVPEHADSLDFEFDDIAGLEPLVEVGAAARAHGPGTDQLARLKLFFHREVFQHAPP